MSGFTPLRLAAMPPPCVFNSHHDGNKEHC